MIHTVIESRTLKIGWAGFKHLVTVPARAGASCTRDALYVGGLCIQWVTSLLGLVFRFRKV